MSKGELAKKKKKEKIVYLLAECVVPIVLSITVLDTSVVPNLNPGVGRVFVGHKVSITVSFS